ncbi:hypothetical protein K5X82_10375 [Halosquirtibacter xylanolyticus]|uniref:LPS assembly lipoprotein LptE n=1 Tax=Halosquirtibacter xylanolyticus TaxID=3374599 RepID=UPI00374A7EB3|nr:hypothetical protein K5X82_10375 [Prolixibacteraceae bacterium]
MKQRIAIIIACVITFSLYSSCKIGYSFTGASLSPEVKTFFVDYFANRARIVNPKLSQEFNNKMNDKFSNELGLTSQRNGGDIEFSGQITRYETRPLGIETTSDGRDIAGQMRFTIGVRVKFVNNIDHDKDFNQTFTAYEDYTSSQNFASIEDEYVGVILDKIITDIFNKSAANW